jgi:hypothetical protein
MIFLVPCFVVSWPKWVVVPVFRSVCVCVCVCVSSLSLKTQAAMPAPGRAMCDTAKAGGLPG